MNPQEHNPQEEQQTDTETVLENNQDAGDDISKIVEEEVNATAIDEGSAEINASDFAVEKEQPGQEITGELEDQKPPAPAEPAGKDQKTPAADNKNAQDEGKSKAKEKAASDKDAAVKRLFKPETVMLFYNMVARKVGAIAKPEYPEIVQLNEQDQKDIGILLGETAEEENWERVPAKWLLLIMVAMKGFEIYFIWNKQHLWPKNKGKGAADPDKDQQLAYVRERAKIDAELDLKRYQETITRLEALIEKQGKQIEMLTQKFAGSVPKNENNIQEVSFEEIPARHFRGYDMEIISFKDTGVITDPTKAGLDGYDEKGMKIGRPLAEHKEVFEHFKRYEKFKKNYSRNVA
jgi:hypothetical protein